MRKGYSITLTSTDSSDSRYLFLSKRFLVLVLSVFILLAVLVIVAVASYAKVYYRAVQADILKRRNVEIESEFAKLKEIEEKLDLAEASNEKIKLMLGIEKTPPPVEPVIDESVAIYTKHADLLPEKESNIPSLLPTIGEISRSYVPGHEAIDIAAPRFSVVIATASGEVSATGWDSLYGNYIIIQHDDNYSTFYGHLNSVNTADNASVAGGEIIGTVGSSGRSTSPHLHYEVRFRDKPVDPMGYVPYFVKI